MDCKATILTAALLCSCVSGARGETKISVMLDSCRVAESAVFPVGRKLTFGNPTTSHVGYPRDWRGVEATPIFENTNFVPSWLFRFRKETNEDQYALGRPGVSQVTDSDRVRFAPDTGRRVADLEIPLVTSADTKRVIGNFSLQLIQDSGTIAVRPAECRQGTIRLDSSMYPVRLVLTNANNPIYAVGGGTACLIDRTGRMDFPPLPRLAADGTVELSARVSTTGPFVLGNRRLRIASIDPRGRSLVIEPYQGSDTLLTIGFYCPDWSVTSLDGTPVSLTSTQGKVRLLFFWSTTCGFCEKVRPSFNGLIHDNDSSRFQSIACCLEKDTMQIHEFLADRPYEGHIVPYDSLFWNRFNHRMTTPAFFLVDQKGIIRFAGSGASMFAIAERAAEDLLDAH